jgi:uncharacterized protein YdeI (YjbR/CyaY-like superfamily)
MSRINFNREHPQYLLFDMSKSTDHEFLDRSEWRRWLQEHHSSEKEIWVLIHKKDSGKKGLKYEEAVEEAVCFGWIDGKMQSVDDFRFRQRFSPRKKNSPWSKSNKQRAEKMIQTGKMTPAGFETISEAKRNGKWDTAYSSSMVPSVPKDLEEALKKNGLSWMNFKSYSNSTKLQCIYWVNNAKKDETRRKRIANLVMKAGQLDIESR